MSQLQKSVMRESIIVMYDGRVHYRTIKWDNPLHKYWLGESIIELSFTEILGRRVYYITWMLDGRVHYIIFRWEQNPIRESIIEL